MISIYVVAVLGFITYIGLRLQRRKPNHLPFPPGPKPWPIVGNITDVPANGVPEYQHWLTHKDIYGPISSITILGQLMVVLHDREAVQQLLEKSSLITSSRPSLEFASKLCGFGKFVSLLPYGREFREHRKLMHQQLGTKNLVARYNDIQEVETGRLLLRVLDTPEKLMQHFQTEAGAIILKATYGYTIRPDEVDPLVKLIERMMENLSNAFIPMTWAVDIMPSLKHLPEWVPGFTFHKVAKDWEKVNQAVTDIPYDFTKRQMAIQNHTSSYISRILEEAKADGEEIDIGLEDRIKSSAAILYAGGSDTTVATLFSFVLAMIKFPDVQTKAQEEIDRLTNSERLPGFDDWDSLPYVQSVAKEALRWFPVAPMGMAHTSDEDIIIKGYFIPKGTILMPAIRWLLHDPQVYADPSRFDPERYSPPRNEPDPEYAFGFGRRICPGRHFAESSLFLTIAQLLATFDMRKAVDSSGQEIEPRIDSTPGIIDHPPEYSYRITPRSPKHVSLVKQLEKKYPWEKGDTDALARTEFM